MRKGSRRIADIPPKILKQLNRGEIPALSLAECLAIDFAQLMKNAFPDVSSRTIARMKAESQTGWVGRTRLAGQFIAEDMGMKVLPYMLAHASDQVRGWGSALVAAQPKMPLKKRLALIRPLADDGNAGVRETVWIMLRPFIAEDLDAAFDVLMPWTKDKSANIRRFASEITRPRGVWCAHIPELRRDPARGLPVLEPLCSDPSRYVQNSVANWLNDASKDDPAFVKKTVSRWQKKSRTKETAYIARRAMRTINE